MFHKRGRLNLLKKFRNTHSSSSIFLLLETLYTICLFLFPFVTLPITHFLLAFKILCIDIYLQSPIYLTGKFPILVNVKNSNLFKPKFYKYGLFTKLSYEGQMQQRWKQSLEIKCNF